MDERTRFTVMRNYCGNRFLLQQLSQIEELAVIPSGRSQLIQYKVGDVVTYQLSPAKQMRATHATAE